MKKSHFTITNTTISLLFLLSLPTLSLSQTCNKNDEKVLFQIKKSLGNPYHLASWQTTEDCCTWYCVECDPNTSRIISLTIFSGQISGQIPNEVGDLPYLQTLVFRKLTNLTGNIPPAIAKLAHLTILRLSWTNLSGPVPSFLSQLKNLDLLELSYNDLTGSIPPELSTLTKINSIYLDHNKLTGGIPESFGRFTGNVPYLGLSHNQLTGTIPVSLGYLNFTSIDFSHNELSGDLSMFFGKNKTIQIVYFSGNGFEFDLSEVEFPTSLTWLELSGNKIYGSLPASLTGLNLQYFNASYNQLCGKIPQGGELQKFDNTSYFHNRCLCGTPLPDCT